VIFRTRDLLVRQRTSSATPCAGIRPSSASSCRRGWPRRAAHRAGGRSGDGSARPSPPDLAIIAESIPALQAKITVLDREIAARAKVDPVAKRLMTIPGVGPVVATALVALAPPASTFRRGRDFAAWMGLTPRQSPAAQGAPRPHLQSGRAQSAPADHPRRELRGKGRRARPVTGQPVAGRHAVAQAAHARHRSARQQDRQDRSGR